MFLFVFTELLVGLLGPCAWLGIIALPRPNALVVTTSLVPSSTHSCAVAVPLFGRCLRRLSVPRFLSSTRVIPPRLELPWFRVSLSLASGLWAYVLD